MSSLNRSASRGSHRRRALGLLGSLACSALIGATMVTPADAVLAATNAVGPRDAATGYPSWYKDSSGTKVKLCITSPLCVGGDSRPDSSLPARVDNGNLPEEAFYAFAEAEINLNGGGRVRWRAVLEGAWLAEEVVQDDQMTFTRIQLSASKLPRAAYAPGSTITATTPYGPISGTVKSDGTLRTRRESAPGIVDNGFSRPATETTTKYGPKFLRWDAGAPSGYLGDPDVDHTVTGAKTGEQNAVTVRNAAGTVVGSTNLFSVAGQIVP